MDWKSERKTVIKCEGCGEVIGVHSDIFGWEIDDFEFAGEDEQGYQLIKCKLCGFVQRF